MILGKISNIPSGYGVRDASMAGMLYFISGIDPVVAIEITLLHRFIIMTVPYIIIGAPFSFHISGSVIRRRTSKQRVAQGVRRDG
jgi:uncharacterized membrane protein YbhN (UPF0104 family)